MNASDSLAASNFLVNKRKITEILRKSILQSKFIDMIDAIQSTFYVCLVEYISNMNSFLRFSMVLHIFNIFTNFSHEPIFFFSAVSVLNFTRSVNFSHEGGTYYFIFTYELNFIELIRPPPRFFEHG